MFVKKSFYFRAEDLDSGFSSLGPNYLQIPLCRKVKITWTEGWVVSWAISIGTLCSLIWLCWTVSNCCIARCRGLKDWTGFSWTVLKCCSDGDTSIGAFSSDTGIIPEHWQVISKLISKLRFRVKNKMTQEFGVFFAGMRIQHFFLRSGSVSGSDSGSDLNSKWRKQYICILIRSYK